MPEAEAIKFIVENNQVDEDTAKSLYREVQNIRTEQEANSWIAPWPNYDSGVVGCSRESNMLSCERGVIVDLEEMDAFIQTNQGAINPGVFSYPTADGEMKTKDYENEYPYGVTLIPNSGGNFGVLLARKELSASMFTRMYFLDGHGLEHFKKTNAQNDANGLQIYTYQVDWEGGTPTLSGQVPELELEKTTPAPVVVEFESNETENVTENITEEE
jgi:hypothetical protein